MTGDQPTTPVVRVPASSANLGPGFDALGIALTLHLEASTAPLPGDSRRPPADDGHPAVRAFRRLGGQGPLYVRSPIPAGRGLGFSGAARVAGLVAACLQRDGRFDQGGGAGPEVLALAAELEGHADNVAASLLGGIVATAGGKAVRVPTPLDPAVVVWVPRSSTSTDESRGRLPATVSLDDAVFNVGRTALLVAALAAGDVGALRAATEDRLHQEVRFGRAEGSRRAAGRATDAGAWCSWLSGSGPTIAALCDRDAATAVAAALGAGEDDASVKVLHVDHAGAVVSPRNR